MKPSKSKPSAPGLITRNPCRQKKAIEVSLHGHTWMVYPMKAREQTIYRVYHRVNGKRHAKNFSTLAKAKADAKSLLRDFYDKGDNKIHLTDEEKLDWQAAMKILKEAGIRNGLETVTRHYSDLVKVVGHASLLTDVARKYAESQGQSCKAVKLSALRDAYVETMKKRNLSKRYIDAQRSHTGQFLKHAGERMSDEITREVIQNFIDSKKGFDARTRLNLLDAIRSLMKFGKSQRYVPREWDEADNVITPPEKQKLIRTYTAEELKKLLAAASPGFRPILALQAFAGLRSSEVEGLDWKHIRLMEEDPRDRIIKLDVDVTEEASKRSVPIRDTLYGFLAPYLKSEGKLWTGKHHAFYRQQQKIAKKAGLQWKANALRHTCVSARVAETRSIAQVAYECGNSVEVIKRHYLDLMTPSMADAWFSTTRKVVLD